MGLLGVGTALVELMLGAAAVTGGGLVVRACLALGLGAAVASSRFMPLVGVTVLALVEMAGFVTGTPLAVDEVAVAVVVFQCARRGGRATLWVSGLLVPAAYLLSGAFLADSATGAAQRVRESGLTDDSWSLVLLLLTIASPLALPWLLGWTLRWRARAEQGRRALAVAQAEAEASERQARLTREVHDVVGHSLVVILRQAESIRFLGDQTPAEVLEVVDTIADSARISLTEVRRVLSSAVVGLAASDLDGLITRIPASAAAVSDRVVGSPRPLPRDIAPVAHRVLQEMLTNALKHGTTGTIQVLRDWTGGLRLVVTNPTEGRGPDDGTGLVGMRQRLAVVGGTLEVRRDRDQFTVEAWIPLCGSGRLPS